MVFQLQTRHNVSPPSLVLVKNNQLLHKLTTCFEFFSPPSRSFYKTFDVASSWASSEFEEPNVTVP